MTGEDTKIATDERGHLVSDLALFMRGMRDGWQIDPVIRRAVVARCAQVLQNAASTKREIARAAQTLVAIDRLVADSIIEEHRMTRLDKGESTENVAHAHAAITPDGLAALSATLRLNDAPRTGD